MQRIVVLTGAGVSAESGVATFADSRGRRTGTTEVLQEANSIAAWRAEPQLVHRHQNDMRRTLRSSKVQPNAAHHALASLQAEIGSDLTVVTQNIDDLHERAGHENVLHMHGSLFRRINTETGESVDDFRDIPLSEKIWRADVTLFGERVRHLPAITEALQRCTLFVAVGTSGTVPPAAQFVLLAAMAGAVTIEANTNTTAMTPQFTTFRRGPASKTIPRLVAEILAVRSAHGL